MNLIATQYEVLEWGYTSGKIYSDPFNSIDLDVVLEHESGIIMAGAGFLGWWTGMAGAFRPSTPWRITRSSTICSDVDNPTLHGQDSNITSFPIRRSASFKMPWFLDGWLLPSVPSNLPMAPLSFGWAIPGGWDYATV